MRNHTRVSVVAVCLAMFPAAARGQAPAPATHDAPWERVLSLPPQTDVTIVLEDGKKRKYRFAGATEQSLRLLSRNGQEQTLAKREIAQVLRRGVNDRVLDGVMNGAVTGATTMAALTGLAYAACKAASSRCPGAGPAIAIATGAGAGAGAGIGWVIDKLHKGTEPVFSAPPGHAARIDVIPMVGPRERGVLLSIGF